MSELEPIRESTVDGNGSIEIVDEETGEVKTLRSTGSGLFDALIRLDYATAFEISVPANLPFKEFARGVRAVKSLHKKSAFWWGQIYKMGRQVYGQDFYQMLDEWDYQEATLQNYARLTEQIDPSLWNEPLPDRQFIAIGQNVRDPEEQRQWVEYAKESRVSGDKLRDEIHRDHEERGIRPKPRVVTWHVCERCNGEGGWPEDEEENHG